MQFWYFFVLQASYLTARSRNLKLETFQSPGLFVTSCRILVACEPFRKAFKMKIIHFEDIIIINVCVLYNVRLHPWCADVQYEQNMSHGMNWTVFMITAGFFFFLGGGTAFEKCNFSDIHMGPLSYKCKIRASRRIRQV